jgi:hypothetical protein
VFQLTTDRKELEIALPADASAAQAVALVDGRRVEARMLDANRLAIPLGGSRGSRGVAVELRYHFTGMRPPRGEIAFEFPRLLPGAWTRRIYWQLILPANEHLITNPDGFTGEFTWSWAGGFWRRTPLIDQAGLESWSGAAARDGLPDRANIYLFSAMGQVEQAEVWTAGRTWIVLWASGAALVIGLLLIYVPGGRHPAMLLVAGSALLAAGLIVPEPTLLLAQAASLGLVLTLLAGLLERGVARRRKASRRTESSHSQIELGSTHTIFRPTAAGNSRTTETLPPQPTGDVQP